MLGSLGWALLESKTLGQIRGRQICNLSRQLFLSSVSFKIWSLGASLV